MGQKVNPIGFRVGIYRDWDAHWFVKSSQYGDYLLEDIRLRNFLESFLAYFFYLYLKRNY